MAQINSAKAYFGQDKSSRVVDPYIQILNEPYNGYMDDISEEASVQDVIIQTNTLMDSNTSSQLQMNESVQQSSMAVDRPKGTIEVQTVYTNQRKMGKYLNSQPVTNSEPSPFPLTTVTSLAQSRQSKL